MAYKILVSSYKSNNDYHDIHNVMNLIIVITKGSMPCWLMAESSNVDSLRDTKNDCKLVIIIIQDTVLVEYARPTSCVINRTYLIVHSLATLYL